MLVQVQYLLKFVMCAFSKWFAYILGVFLLAITIAYADANSWKVSENKKNIFPLYFTRKWFKFTTTAKALYIIILYKLSEGVDFSYLQLKLGIH